MDENFGTRPFRIEVEQADLADLQERLRRTRWTDEVEGAGWDYGTNLGYLKELVDYWQNASDWRAQEERLNRLAQFRAQIGGFGVHFLHERGKGPDPMPILLLHGWPDSFYRFHKVVPMLTDPATPVPPRFLPHLDNALLSHADRTRIIADDHRRCLIASGGMGSVGTVLVDGFVRGTWKTERTRGIVTLLIEPFGALSKRDRDDLVGEGERFLRFVAEPEGAEAAEVRFVETT